MTSAIIDEDRFARIIRRLDAIAPGDTVILIVPRDVDTDNIVNRLCTSLTDRGRVSKIIAELPKSA